MLSKAMVKDVWAREGKWLLNLAWFLHSKTVRDNKRGQQTGDESDVYAFCSYYMSVFIWNVDVLSTAKDAGDS
jgi:hypothetical protein